MSLLKIFKLDRKLITFLLWVSFGLGFSMSIILSTIGLMEGFERSLLLALNKSNGDFSLSSPMLKNDLQDLTENLSVDYPALTSRGFYKVEAFVVGKNKQSKGAVILSSDFKKRLSPIFGITEKFELKKGEAIIGEDLAQELSLKRGDIFRALISSGSSAEFSIKNFKTKDFFKTNLYEKDSRVVIVNINEFFPAGNIQFNYSIFNFNYPFGDFESQKNRIKRLNDDLYDIDENLYATAYWEDYSTLIEAVEIEKISILIVLQVIVVVSVFNLISFLIFFREKKIKELFTLHALGLTPQRIALIWYTVSACLWGVAVVISTGLVSFFDKFLVYLSTTMMPKNIYHLGTINLYVSAENYFIVYIISFCWILLMTFFLTKKFKSDSLLKGLRQQYS
jgi:ABC-type lipoprotein release transport system permease subunit